MAEPAHRSYVVPAVLLVALLTVADLWASHHLDFSLTRKPGWLTLVLTSVGAAWGFLGWALTKEEKDQTEDTLRARIRSVAQVVFHPAGVAVLAGAFGLAVLLFSSITVVAEPGTNRTSVSLARMGASGSETVGLDRDRPQATFARLLTSPLAGPYVVRASGYLPVTVEALPLLGGRVRLGRDVARSPAVLVRPVSLLLADLRDGGHLQVTRVRGGRETEVARSANAQVGSFLLGRQPAELRQRVPDWDRDLVAAGYTDLEARGRAIKAWLQVLPLPLAGDLAPGDTLEVQVIGPGGNVTARDQLVLGIDDEDFFFNLPAGGPAQ